MKIIVKGKAKAEEPDEPVDAVPSPEAPEKSVKLPKVGEEVTVTKLTNLYGPHGPDVLRERLSSAPRAKKGAPRRFKVTSALPTPTEYQAIKRARYTTTVESLVDDAFSDIEAVTEEVRGWYDNLPEGLQQGDRGSRLEEAASNLENLQKPDVPEEIAGVAVVHIPGLKVESRAARVQEAASMLRDVHSALENYDDDDAEGKPDCETCEGVGKVNCDECGTEQAKDCDACEGTGKAKCEGLSDFLGELESAADEAENVEIPGMYD